MSDSEIYSESSYASLLKGQKENTDRGQIIK